MHVLNFKLTLSGTVLPNPNGNADDSQAGLQPLSALELREHLNVLATFGVEEHMITGHTPATLESHHIEIAVSEAEPFQERALRLKAALTARINGEWDHPELVKYGPLQANLIGDIQHMIDEALGANGACPQ